jgi:hypothetical protein
MGKSRIQQLREKWTGHLAGQIPWGKFTPRDMELALEAERSWRERFWNKHSDWLEATGLDKPLDEQIEAIKLREEVDELRSRLRAMEESSPGRELIGAITRTRWFKRQLQFGHLPAPPDTPVTP